MVSRGDSPCPLGVSGGVDGEEACHIESNFINSGESGGHIGGKGGSVWELGGITMVWVEHREVVENAGAPLIGKRSVGIDFCHRGISRIRVNPDRHSMESGELGHTSRSEGDTDVVVVGGVVYEDRSHWGGANPEILTCAPLELVSDFGEVRVPLSIEGNFDERFQ